MNNLALFNGPLLDNPTQEVELEFRTYSGGEEHVRILGRPGGTANYVIVARLKSSSDVMRLVLLVDAVRRWDQTQPRIALHLPYLPYARQDRVCNPGESHAVGAFSHIINGLKLHAIQLWDCHSDVGASLLDNAFNSGLTEIWTKFCVYDQSFGKVIDESILVSPDAGANKKVYGVARSFNRDFVRADKVRDTATGNIVETQVYGLDGHSSERPLLVVDDICDGGRTFIELAKVLENHVHEHVPLYLYVTHGIFSQGYAPLLAHYDKIFVANNLQNDRFFEVIER
jgi:ribose-phosphate pyrophosphokinase